MRFEEFSFCSPENRQALLNLRQRVREAGYLYFDMELGSLYHSFQGIPYLFVCFDGQEAVGLVMFHFFSKDEAELQGMVDPRYRRQGIFSRLMAMAGTVLDDNGFKSALYLVEEGTTDKAVLGKVFPCASLDHTELRLSCSQEF